MITHSLENIDILPTKRFPIVFHGIVGKDQRERSSPSFFNIEEATTVKKYCYNLIADRKKGISKSTWIEGNIYILISASEIEHIGVITPYHSQKCKIQLLLSREPMLNGIKVGSVDEFQGQVSLLLPFFRQRLINQNHLTGAPGDHSVDGSQYT